MGFGSAGNSFDTVNIDYISGVVTVGTTEVLAAANGSSNLENRQELVIYNDSESVVFIGPTGVATSGSTKGIPIEAGETVNIQAGPLINLYLISTTAGNSVIVQELS